MLLLHIFLVAMKEIGDGLSMGGSSIIFRVILAFVTKSFSVRLVGVAFGRVLSTVMSSCLLVLSPLAMTSACSGLVGP